jgi:probable HAF family extracellular repeat protein
MATSLQKLFALIVFSAVSAKASPMYSIVDIGNFGGVSTDPRGINSVGWVTGQADISDNSTYHAFLYDGTTIRDLGTLDGTPGAHSSGQGVNAAGEVAGFSYTATNGNRAFLYNGTTMRDLGTLGGSDSQAFGINAAGQVTGGARKSDNSSEDAFLYNGITMIDLGTTGGSSSVGWGINDAGEVTGYSAESDGLSIHAFLYNGTTMQDLGTLGGTNSFGYGINASGEVTGQSDVSSTQHAFLYNGTMMQDLGTLGGDTTSSGQGMNASGEVVGYSLRPGFIRPFLYDGTSMYDLNSLLSNPIPGVRLSDAWRINDRGQIVVNGGTSSGYVNTYLLTPILTTPEPRSFWLFLFGMIGVIGFRYRRRSRCSD